MTRVGFEAQARRSALLRTGTARCREQLKLSFFADKWTKGNHVLNFLEQHLNKAKK